MRSFVVTHHSTGQDLLTHAGTFLERDEAENGLLLGLAAAGTTGGPASSSTRERSLWISVHEPDGEAPVVAVAVRTPPFNLVLSRASATMLEALVRDLRSRGVELPGVMAPAETARAFAGLWTTPARAFAGLWTTGGVPSPARYRVTMRQGVYALRRVTPPAPDARAPGRLRRAESTDLPLILDWMDQFALDASLPRSETRVYQERARAMIADGSLFVWENDEGELVSMAFLQGKTPHGIRISMVYTPKVRRGRGFATTFVADLSAHVLASGRQLCMLYADLANPTSNAIYQRVGYELVGESIAIGFD